MTTQAEIKERLEKIDIKAPGVRAGDIPYDLAVSAHSGTSYSPEIRGYQQQMDYINHMNAVYEDLSRQAKTPEQKQILNEEFERYRKGYAEHQKGYLYSHSRIVSSMIAGPSNFPTRTMNKRNDALHNKLNDWMEWDKKAQKAIGRKVNPVMYSISSDRADAVDLLKKQLDKAEKLQNIMVESNKIIRNKTLNQDDKIAKLKALGHSEYIAKELFEKDFAGRIGFADYQLTNNSANIRRIKGRIEVIGKRRSQTTNEFTFEGGKVIDNVEENRIQIAYDGKPSPDIIAKLKKRGFHWSPYNKVWQRMRSNDANYAVHDIVGKITKVQSEQTEPTKEIEPNTIAMPDVEIKQESKPAPVLELPSTSMTSLENIHSRRSPQARASDEAQKHSITLSPTDKRIDRWKNDQGSADVRGIDTFHLRTPKMPSPRKTKAKIPSSSMKFGKMYVTKLGRTGMLGFSRHPIKGGKRK
jgi:hypothetical protein